MLPLIYCIAGTFCATLVDNVRPDILEKRRRTKALSIANEQNLYNFVYLKTHVNLYVEANLIHQIQEIVTTMGNGTFAKLEISEVQETKSGHKSPNLEVIRILHVMNCCFNDVQQKYIALLDEIVDGIDASSRYNDTLNSLPQTCEEQEDPLTCYDQGTHPLYKDVISLSSTHNTLKATEQKIIDEDIPNVKECFKKQVVRLNAAVELAAAKMPNA